MALACGLGAQVQSTVSTAISHYEPWAGLRAGGKSR
jgi:hypothetical protein